MAATKKAAAPVEEVDQKEEAPQEPSQEVATVEEETVVSAPTKSFTPNNTWTAYYGTNVYSFIEGKTVELPVEVANWFSHSR